MKNKKTETLIALLFCVGSFNAGWAKQNPNAEKAKIYVDEASDALKRAIDRFEDNLEAIQNYLNHYNWKGMIQDEANSGNTTLRHMVLNGHSRATLVKPGERINGTVQCYVDRAKSSSLSLYRIALGITGRGAQTTIGNEFGLAAGESLEKFVLIAPTEPGVYQIRFRVVDSYLLSNALEAWVDDKGNEPDASTTMGVIIVK